MLHVHRAERADGLVEALRALLGEPLPDAFAPEVVAVPTRGMERWLTQRMSERLGASEGRFDGVCANVMFPSPGRLLGDAVALASGVEPEEDPWLPERAVWPLLEVLEGCLGEPWLESVSSYLGCAEDPPDPVRRARRLSVVRHVAGLFDRYALHRPDMIAAWGTGLDTDGTGAPVPANAAWQPELWRRLRAGIGSPGPAERRASACARIRADPAILELPQRVSLFGLTRLPTGHLEVLEALAAHREVHLFLLHPSPALWHSISQATEDTSRIVLRRDDPTAERPANRLLASWGRDAREMQLVVARGKHADHHHPLTFGSDTLLARIQADVRIDRSPPGAPLPEQADTRPLIEPNDRSLQVHSCHGRARQVEVVRDAILHELAGDPTLEPRDVIVMCPDIETFAPLIQATFGAGEVSGDADQIEPLPRELRPVDLRVRLADRSLRQTNPVLGVVAQLLELAEQRVTASQVLDFADRGPVRRRFRFDDDDLMRLQGWIADSGIRWGLDAAHRAPFGLDSLVGGTWRAGLDRLLLGVTMTEDEQRLFEGVLPLDDVESGAIDLAGRFAELIARLQDAIGALSTPKPLDDWVELVGTTADSLTATSERDAWQRSELQRVLDDLVREATAEDTVATTPVGLVEIRALLAERLQGRPTRANFRTGHLTICTLVPMRSVPHRVVCLLGLDDGAFPRKAPRDGDDLTLDEPRVGERDPRTEDRQLLLDALLSATDRLIITYTGNDERTNAPLPPAVPVGELLDTVDATARADNDGRARDRVVIRHPLQPFDPRNFTRGGLVRDGSWSFDPVTLEGARALRGPRSDLGPFLAEPLSPLDTGLVEVDDLVWFAQHPVRAFLRRRLRISLRDYTEEIEDGLPVELDALERWAVGQRLLDARLAGVEGRTAILAEIARGTLPPGVLGQPVVEAVYPTVDLIVAEAEALVGGERQAPIDVRVSLSNDRRLTGTIGGVRGDVLLTTTYSRVSAKQRLVAWVRLLALSVAVPECAFSAATVGRAGGNATVTIARIRPLAADAESRRETALEQLSTLIDLYERGMRQPLPLYCQTSAAYAEAAAAGRDPMLAARRAWTSEWNYDREDKEPEHQLVLGGVRTLDDLLAEPPQQHERGQGWEMSETTRFGRCARRLWDGLLTHEEVTSR